MAYGVLADVRALAGNPSTAEVPDADITTFIGYVDSLINSYFGKDDWASGDAEYKTVQMASNIYAAAMILDRFKDQEGKAKTFREEFWKMLENLAATTAVKVIALGYRTSPLKDDETGDLVEP